MLDDPRYHVTVFKQNAVRDRFGFSGGKSSRDAMERFIRSRRAPSLKQLQGNIAAVCVKYGDQFYIYGPEEAGFPLVDGSNQGTVDLLMKIFGSRL